MKTRTYLKGCEFCKATGVVPTGRSAGSVSTSVIEPCPVCNGDKTVWVTETEE